MHLNKKGQALIEFILVIPLLLMIVTALIDFGQIIYNKNVLETEINYLVDDYNNNLELKTEIKNTNIEVNKNNYKTEIVLSKNINILTPGLNLVLDNPFKASVSRVITNEA